MERLTAKQYFSHYLVNQVFYNSRHVRMIFFIWCGCIDPIIRHILYLSKSLINFIAFAAKKILFRFLNSRSSFWFLLYFGIFRGFSFLFSLFDPAKFFSGRVSDQPGAVPDFRTSPGICRFHAGPANGEGHGRGIRCRLEGEAL